MACLKAFGHVIKHGESLVTKHFKFDRSRMSSVNQSYLVFNYRKHLPFFITSPPTARRELSVDKIQSKC